MANQKPRRKSTNRDPALRAQARAWRDLYLAKPPTQPRALELWLQHAAGKILFERVRAAGLAHPDPALPAKTRKVAKAAVDSAIYALMMLIEGVSDHLHGSGHEVRIKFLAQLLNEEGDLQLELDLSQGDGMCMGYHAWRGGDFGEDPVLVKNGGAIHRRARAAAARDAVVIVVDDEGEPVDPGARGSARPSKAPRKGRKTR